MLLLELECVRHRALAAEMQQLSIILEHFIQYLSFQAWFPFKSKLKNVVKVKRSLWIFFCFCPTSESTDCIWKEKKLYLLGGGKRWKNIQVLFDNQRIFQRAWPSRILCVRFLHHLKLLLLPSWNWDLCLTRSKARTCGLYTKPKVLGDTFLQEKQEKVSKNFTGFYFLLAIIKLFLGVQLGGSSLQSLTRE